MLIICELTAIICYILYSVLLINLVDCHKTPHFAENHSTIVHLFEWKWEDVANECEQVLGPHGYGGVQISPPNENVIIREPLDRPWWERYQPLSYQLISRSGNEEQFADMVRRCNDAGVRIYADALLNHMTGAPRYNIGTANNTAEFGQWSYPAVPYTFEHFNQPVCDIEWDDYGLNSTAIRVCQLSGLQDLNQTHPHVREMLLGFMNTMIDYGISGFRIDAAKHMWPEDLAYIFENLHDLPVIHGFQPNSRPFIYLEVIDYGTEAISRDEYTPLARVAEFKYGNEMFYCFTGQNDLRWLINWGPDWAFLPTGDALVFIDNHDNQRGHIGDGTTLTYKDPKPYVAAIAFMLSHPYGEPQIMSSYHFEDTEVGPPMDENENMISVSTNQDGSCGNGWVCEHRWHPIRQMVAFRNYVGDAEISEWWDNEKNQIAFCRGNRGFIAFNIENQTMTESLQTCLPPGRYCDIITGEPNEAGCTGKTVTVDINGYAVISISPDDEHYVLALRVGQEAGGESNSSTTHFGSVLLFIAAILIHRGKFY